MTGGGTEALGLWLGGIDDRASGLVLGDSGGFFTDLTFVGCRGGDGRGFA
jgi:hypothetical protein